jgi:hypothetical protein
MASAFESRTAFCDQGRIAETPFHKLRAGIHGGAMAFGEIIENRDLMAGIKEFFDADRTDVACAARDENVHCHSIVTSADPAQFGNASRSNQSRPRPEATNPSVILRHTNMLKSNLHPDYPKV